MSSDGSVCTGGVAARVGAAFLSLSLAALLLAGLWLCFPDRARAAVESGALSQLAEPSSCVGEEEHEQAKCDTRAPYGLEFAYEVQLSPDGRYAYSVGVKGDLIEYSRNQANGALSIIGCFSSRLKSEPACAGVNAEMEVAAVNGPAAIAISPDGKSVYVVSQGNNTLAEFSRNAETGLLTKIGCVTHEGSLSECEAVGAKGLGTPYGVTVSPEGENVYVTGLGEEAVAEFKRNTETGLLTQLEAPNNCISSNPLSECGTTIGVIGLHEDIGVVASPDGKNLYVSAGAQAEKGDIAAFARGAEGALTQLPGKEACISEQIAECTTGAEAEHVQGSEDLIISPDGKHIYANSHNDSAVIELERTESGALKQLPSPNECVSATALSNCQKATGISGPLGVAISPQGESLYVTSANENAVAAFSVGTQGALTQLAADPCVTENPSGCEPPGANERVGLKFARRLTVSPDGTNVYVAGQEDHAIAELARTVTPTATRVSLDHGSTAGGASVRIKGSGFAEGAKVFFGKEPAANVTVNSATSITAVSPAGKEETVPVTVENPAGASAEASGDRFTYTDTPAVAGVSPSLGSEAGGTAVTITGSEFLAGATVHFGANPASAVTVNSSTSITATSPPGAGTVHVTVTTANGTSQATPADLFSYVNGSAKSLSGLFLEGYCQSVGFQRVTLEREEVGGPGFAYENWACMESNGTEVPIANTGAAPSMQDACLAANPSVTAYAYPEDPNSAFSWGCYEVEPPPAKGKEEGITTGNTATVASVKTATVVTTGAGSVVPPPTLARTGNVAPVSGQVLVKLPGSSAFVPLASLRQIPFGTVIEATNGHVSVTTALPNGHTQTGEFFSGQFVLTQGPNGMVIATLTGGNFSVCPTARERGHQARASAAHATGSHVVRKLWANAHGSFSTKGNYAAGAVQGTEWLTEDLCDGTLIRVTRDKVAVTNLLTHRHVEVKVGHRYLAKAP
jgi:DNA-binding beta-propeller fold protein YncE